MVCVCSEKGLDDVTLAVIGGDAKRGHSVLRTRVLKSVRKDRSSECPCVIAVIRISVSNKDAHVHTHTSAGLLNLSEWKVPLGQIGH